MGATELIQGLGRALAVLREAGHPQHVVQQLEDDITSLDAILFRDAGEAEQRAARLVARLYGIAHPAHVQAEAPASEPAPEPAAEPEPAVPADPAPTPAVTPEPVSTPPESSPASSDPADAPVAVTPAAIPAEPDVHMATPAEVTGAAQ